MPTARAACYIPLGRGRPRALCPEGTAVPEQASNTVAEGDARGATGAAGTLAFDDMALVNRSRKGDMNAFGALVAKYQDRIFNMVCRMGPTRAEAEEIAQEAFLKALERLGQFRGHSKFYTWLFRIAANLAISNRRRAARIRFHSLATPEQPDGTQARDLSARLEGHREPNPQAAAVSAETGRRVMRALEELDDEFRLVVVLRDIEDMDYHQIAEVTELPIGTVKSRLHRARLVLKRKLADLVN